MIGGTYGDQRETNTTFSFDEARRWSYDSQLDMIAEVREMIGR